MDLLKSTFENILPQNFDTRQKIALAISANSQTDMSTDTDEISSQTLITILALEYLKTKQ